MRVEEWLGKDNKLGADIWYKKYQFDNETFDQWLNRVSGGDEKLKRQIIDKKFLLGGRILANRGLPQKGVKVTYSNCYVITPPDDSIEEIFDCAKKLARTYSYGGGCGVDLSNLSPRGAKVNNTAKETSGSVSFMDLYSLVTGLIGQNGRRGALMLSLSCDHPDLEEFIGIKQNTDKVTKANISIRVTDRFMAAVKNKEKYTLSFTRLETGETITKEVDAYSIFHKICESNWNWAEPGMLWWDRIENWNLLSCDDSFHYAGTNPCAEEPLPPGGSCLLGSINLSEFVTKDKQFDFDDFANTVDISVKALNNVLDEGLPLHPLKEQRESVSDWRQIGLGIMGLADMLIKMNIRYGSEESINICDLIGQKMTYQALKTSAELAKVIGHYPKYHPEAVMSSVFFSKHIGDIDVSCGLANSQLLTIAPTGTLSTMIGISGGIEPIFANYYTRKTESLHGHDEYYKVYTPIVKKYMDENNIDDDSDLPDFFVTAQTLDYTERIKMQAVWQKHIDASISSTVNVPNDFTVEQVEDLYMKAWEAGLKGVTIFRDGCSRAGILTLDDDKNKKEVPQKLERGMIIKVDNNTVGRERHLVTGCGTLHCSAFFDPDTGDLLECFLNKGSSGNCLCNITGISRMVSLAARAGVDVYTIADQLRSVPACPSYTVRTATKHDTSKGNSCPVAIANALLDMYKEIQDDIFDADEEYEVVSHKVVEVTTSDDELVKVPKEKNKPKCPECGGELLFEGGCCTCKDCGYSRCE